MATIEQWAEWREEYLSGLKAIVDNAPYAFAEFSAKKEYGYFDIEKAKAFVDEAIRLGLISTKDSDYFQKAVFFAETPSAEKYYGKSYSIQETLDLYKEVKLELEGMDNYFTLVHFGLLRPLHRAFYYVFCNHPITMKVALSNLITATNVNIKWNTFRLGLKELFTYLQGMTPYGLNGLLTDIKCSAIYSDDIFEAIQNGDFDSFKALCRDGEIDLTEIAEIAGYIEAIYGKQLDEEPLEDEESIDSVNKDDPGYLRPLITMMGFPADSVIGDLLSLNLGQELLSEFWPNADEDFAHTITLWGFHLANLYHYIGFFYDEELNEVNRILNNPLFEPFSKVAQLLFAAMFKHLPNAVKICFTQDEQNEIATLYFKDEESGDTERNSQINYSDNQPEPNDQEQETIAAASFETGQENDNSSNEYVVLPEDFFSSSYPRDAKNTGQHFNVDYDVEKCGGRKFAQLINTITSWGLVSSSEAKKLVYVLSGRLKPNDYDGDGIEWIDGGYGYELLYIIKYIIGNEKGKYEKARRLFHGTQWLGKGAFKDQADYADAGFRRALNDIYPDICIIKGHVETVREPIHESGDLPIPDDSIKP